MEKKLVNSERFKIKNYCVRGGKGGVERGEGIGKRGRGKAGGGGGGGGGGEGEKRVV